MSTSTKVIDRDIDIRMRVVEALTRTDGSGARNDPELFLKSVAIITTYVVQGVQTPSASPEKGAQSADKASKKSPKEKGDMFS